MNLHRLSTVESTGAPACTSRMTRLHACNTAAAASVEEETRRVHMCKRMLLCGAHWCVCAGCSVCQGRSVEDKHCRTARQVFLSTWDACKVHLRLLLLLLPHCICCTAAQRGVGNRTCRRRQNTRMLLSGVAGALGIVYASLCWKFGGNPIHQTSNTATPQLPWAHLPHLSPAHHCARPSSITKEGTSKEIGVENRTCQRTQNTRSCLLSAVAGALGKVEA
jgi:hypothetical protein